MEEPTYFATDFHAISALVNIAFDLAAIVTYAQGIYFRGPYHENRSEGPPAFEQEYKKLFIAATCVSLAIFGVGCLVRAILAYKYTKSWATAARASIHMELPYQAYRGHRPGKGVDHRLVRMLKMVELCTEMPQTCLAVIVFVLHVCIKGVYDVDTPAGLTSSKDLDVVLILTAVFGIITSSFAAAEQLVDKPWSLWHNAYFALHRQTGKVRWSVVRWLATAVSLTSHVLVYLILSPQLQAKLFAVWVAWFLLCMFIYYCCCRNWYRSIKCGYLSVLMNLPFNPSPNSEQAPHIPIAQLPKDSSVAVELSAVSNPTISATVGANATQPAQEEIRSKAEQEMQRIDSATVLAAAKLPGKCYILSGILAATYCICAFAISVIQARSCWFTTYRCMDVKLGYDVNCKLYASQDYTNDKYYNDHRSLTGVCINVGYTNDNRDTPMEPRIGYIAAAFVALDGILYVAMCVLSRQAKA